VKPDAVQVELGEPSEDASARHGEAVEAQEERDGGQVALSKQGSTKTPL